MNIYWIVAGLLALFGGLAHLFVGERYIIMPLNPTTLTSPKIPGNTIKRYLRWFWHVGTVNIFLAAIIGITIGISDGIIDHELVIAKFLAVIFFGMFGAFCIIAIPSPKHFICIPQGVAMFIGAILFWIGAM